MQFVLTAKLVTPLLTKRRSFHLKGCKWTITKAYRIHFGKLQVAIPMFPFAYVGYVGTLTVIYKCRSLQVAKRKVRELKKIRYIGRYSSEGLGLIQWREGHLESDPSHTRRKRHSRIKIRKGLPSNLPEPVQQLILYGLLHDFYAPETACHKSKIYVEPELANQDLIALLRQSHSQTSHAVVKTFQRYDRMAAGLTRHYKAPKINRYNWKTQEVSQKVDFTALASQIQRIVDTENVFRLYLFVYNSEELAMLNEELEYGHTSLRLHLLLIVNMMVRDYLRGYLEEYLAQVSILDYKQELLVPITD